MARYNARTTGFSRIIAIHGLAKSFRIAKNPRVLTVILLIAVASVGLLTFHLINTPPHGTQAAPGDCATATTLCIETITPNQGSTTDGTAVTITGANFKTEYQPTTGLIFTNPQGVGYTTTNVAPPNQYIDTDVTQIGNVKVELQFKIADDSTCSGSSDTNGTSPMRIFGSWGSAWSNNSLTLQRIGGSATDTAANRCAFAIRRIRASATQERGSTTELPMNNSTPKWDTGVHTWIINPVTSNPTGTWDGANLQYPSEPLPNANGANMYMGYINNNSGNAPSGNGFSGTVFYLKISKDNVLQRDFIPVKRNLDGACGLWDQQNNLFYANIGSGTLTCTVDTSAAPIIPGSDITTVLVGGAPTTNVAVSSDGKTITANTSAHAVGTVDTVVTVNASASSKVPASISTTLANSYTYRPTISQVTPNNGPLTGGTGFGASYNPSGTITINGDGFIGYPSGISPDYINANKVAYTNPTFTDYTSAAPYGGTVTYTCTMLGSRYAWRVFDKIVSTGASYNWQAVAATNVTCTLTLTLPAGKYVNLSDITNYNGYWNPVKAVEFFAGGTDGISLTNLFAVPATQYNEQHPPIVVPDIWTNVITARVTSNGDNVSIQEIIYSGSAVDLNPLNLSSYPTYFNANNLAAPASSVKVGGNDCTSFTVVSNTQITCVPPAGTAGTTDVTVTVNGITSTYATSPANDDYTYRPTISSIAPNFGPTTGGTTVTITGGSDIEPIASLGAEFTGTQSVNSGVEAQTLASITADFEFDPDSITSENSFLFGTGTNANNVTTRGIAFFANSADQHIYVQYGIGAANVIDTGLTTDVGRIQLSFVTQGLAAGLNKTFEISQNGTVLFSHTFTNAVTVLPMIQTRYIQLGGFSSASNSITNLFKGTVYGFSVTSQSGLEMDLSVVSGGLFDAVSDATYLPGVTIKPTTNVTSVDFGGSPCGSITVIADNTIACVTSAHAAGKVDAVVTINGITSTYAVSPTDDDYTYVAPPPEISDIIPDHGPTAGGNIVTVNGSGFQQTDYPTLRSPALHTAPSSATEISTCQDFLSETYNDFGGTFSVINDIDCSSIPNWGYGDLAYEFSGQFYGNGHTISNITSNVFSGGDADGGLFTYLDGGAIYDLNIANITMNAGSSGVNVGAVVGYLTSGTISNVKVLSGSVGGHSSVGGIVGNMENGTIEYAENHADVSADEDKVGGIVGLMSGGGQVTKAANYGAVSGESNVGGIIGYIDSEDAPPSDVFNQGAITGYGSDYWNVAGIIGTDLTGLAVERAYNAGSLTPGDRGAIAFDTAGGVNVSSYWDTDLMPNARPQDEGGDTGKTTAEMKTQSTYVGWDFDTVWQMFETPEVLIDGQPCEVISVISDTQLTCRIPGPHAAGTVDATVSVGGQTATLTGGYTYIVPPTITAITPDHGPITGGTEVTITGTGFPAPIPLASVQVGDNLRGKTIVFDTSVAPPVLDPDGAFFENNIWFVGSSGILFSQTNDGGDDYAFFRNGWYSWTELYHEDVWDMASLTIPDDQDYIVDIIDFTSADPFAFAQIASDPPITVDFGGSPCQNVWVISTTQIKCTTTTHSVGLVDVTISGPTGSGMLADAYTYEELYIALSADKNTAIMHPSPTLGAGEGFDSVDLMVSTNFIPGYKLSISAAQPDLVCASGPTIEPLTGTGSLTVGKWGYGLGTVSGASGSWTGVTPVATQFDSYGSPVDLPAHRDTYLWFGVKIDGTVPACEYVTTVTTLAQGNV
ncbi:hypothetical protein FACS189431_1180 [Alphaproteobacteria bacterium]|nr:hypothetical protein FACS189431_1180 [Alphaproteobacteria bacterium]